MDQKKNHFYYIVMGRIGTLLIMIAFFRYIFITNDVIGRGLTLFGLISIQGSLNFMVDQFLTVKERRIVNWSYFSVMAIIFIIALSIAKKSS